MRPRRIGIELTNRCDFRCAHCARDFESRPPADFGVDLLARLIPQAQALGISYFILTGGEPLLHPDLLRVAHLLASAGCRFHIVTNGSAYRKVAELTAHTPREALAGVCVSVDGATAETHDALRRAASFENALKTISVCVTRQVPVTAHTVISRANLHQIEAIEELLAGLGVGGLTYDHMHPRPGAEELVLSVGERLAAEERVNRVTETSAMPIGFSAGRHSDIPDARCPALALESLSVDVYGRLCFCCQLSGVATGKAPNENEVIADLKQAPLADAVALLAEKVNRFTADKLKAAAAGELSPADHFPCLYCARCFGKLAWLPGSEG